MREKTQELTNYIHKDIAHFAVPSKKLTLLGRPDSPYLSRIAEAFDKYAYGEAFCRWVDGPEPYDRIYAEDPSQHSSFRGRSRYDRVNDLVGLAGVVESYIEYFCRDLGEDLCVLRVGTDFDGPVFYWNTSITVPERPECVRQFLPFADVVILAADLDWMYCDEEEGIGLHPAVDAVCDHEKIRLVFDPYGYSPKLVERFGDRYVGKEDMEWIQAMLVLQYLWLNGHPEYC